MIRLKSEEEIKILAKGGAKLSEILAAIAKAVAPGVSTLDLEKMARNLIKEAGGEPAFLGYETGGGRYPAALCVSVNEAIVHTPATFRYVIQEGDLVSLDLGLRYKGLCTDAATTVIVSNGHAKCDAIASHFARMENNRKLVDTTRKALKEAICECRVGNPISAIGKKIQNIAEESGFNVIRDLVGHGVGETVHEDPMVPNYYDRALDKIKMEEGLTIAIEPMVTAGSGKSVLSHDGFTYITADGQPAAHFEATVAVTKKGPKILTPIV